MNLFTKLIVNRSLDGNKTFTKINIKDELDGYLVSDDEIRLWAEETVLKIQNNQPVDIIHIKLKKEVYLDFVKKLYFRVGKHISLYEEDTTVFRIPMKKGSNFFVNLEKIIISSEELKMPIIAVHF